MNRACGQAQGVPNVMPPDPAPESCRRKPPTQGTTTKGRQQPINVQPQRVHQPEARGQDNPTPAPAGPGPAQHASSSPGGRATLTNQQRQPPSVSTRRRQRATQTSRGMWPKRGVPRCQKRQSPTQRPAPAQQAATQPPRAERSNHHSNQGHTHPVGVPSLPKPAAGAQGSG